MMTREQLIKECTFLRGELEGYTPTSEDRIHFESMDTEKLVQEYNWLWDMVHLK